MTAKNIIPSGLFVESNGKPLQFYVRPCAEKQNLQPLIESMGGVLLNDFNNTNTINLILPCDSPPRDSSNNLEVRFIYECLASNRLLPQHMFRIQSRDISHFVGSDLNKCSKKRALKVDYQIISYIITNQAFDSVKGKALWCNMAGKLGGHRSPLSLRNRFFKHILPALHAYNIDSRAQELIMRGLDISIEETNEEPTTTSCLLGELSDEGAALKDVFSGKPELTIDKSIQLQQLRKCLAEKFHSPMDEVNVGLVETSNLYDSSNEDLEIINPPSKCISLDITGQKNHLDTLKLKLCEKLNAQSLTLETPLVIADFGDQSVLAPDCFTHGDNSTNENEISMETEAEPSILNLSQSLPDDCLQLDSLKKSLGEKLNTHTTKNSPQVDDVAQNRNDESLSVFILEGAKELDARPEQAGFLKRLQARIRDKIQEEIWVDILVSLVSSLPQKYQRTVLDRVKQKLSISDTNSWDLAGVPERRNTTESCISKMPLNTDSNCASKKLDTSCATADRSEDLSSITHTVVTDNTKSGLACVLCDFHTACKVELLKHMGKHIRKCSLTCEFCGKRFMSDCSLLNHIKNIHIQSRLPNCDSFQCCSTKTAPQVVSHERSFKCPICPVVIGQRSSFMLHMKRHTDKQKKQYQCKVCSRVFQSRTELIRHRPVHQVGYSFGGSVHEAIHSGSRVFRCAAEKGSITAHGEELCQQLQSSAKKAVREKSRRTVIYLKEHASSASAGLTLESLKKKFSEKMQRSGSFNTFRL